MKDPSTLHLGVLRVVLLVPGARSLKDRRSVVVSLRDRILHRFAVSCHEVDRGDLPGRGELVVTTAGVEARPVGDVLRKIVSFLEQQGTCTIVDVSQEVMPWTGGDAGAALAWEADRADEPTWGDGDV
jgi:uncharacterized protein YlxP (DUF503 family)